MQKSLPHVRVVSHMEPLGIAAQQASNMPVCTTDELREYQERIDYLLRVVPEASQCHRLSGHYAPGLNGEPQLSLSFHCRMDGSVTVSEAYAVSLEVERLVRQQYPHLGRIVIHMEPYNGHATQAAGA